MDFSPDNGAGWRERISPELRNFGIGILNPCNKPTTIGIETVQTSEKYNNDLRTHNYVAAKEFAKPICGVDLRLVHKADF